MKSRSARILVFVMIVCITVMPLMAAHAEINISKILRKALNTIPMDTPLAIDATIGWRGKKVNLSLSEAVDFRYIDGKLTDEEYELCKDQLVDFAITFEEDVPAGQAILAGYYDAACQWNDFLWVAVPTPELVPAGETVMVMQTAEMPITVENVKEFVKQFKCGITFVGEPVGVKLELVTKAPNAPDTEWVPLYQENFGMDEFEPVKAKSHPKTGDSFPVLPVLCTAVISLAGMYVCGMNVRRKYQR